MKSFREKARICEPFFYPQALPMNVYLYRHADAVKTIPDLSRALSSKGRDQVMRMARFLKGNPVFSADEIWHSPYLRAKQTAELFAKQMELKCPLVEQEGIAPYDLTERMEGLLGEEQRNLLIVGHQPYLEQLALHLLHGDTAGAMFAFKKGAMLCLKHHYSIWEIQWMITPKLLK